MERDIRMTCVPSQEELPCLQEDQMLYVLTEIFPGSSERGKVRLPLDICLVLDNSSSMRGERLFQAKEAARYITKQLTSEDYFCLIIFNDRARVVVPRQAVRTAAAIREHVAEIQASGGTEMARGIEQALNQMRSTSYFGGVRRMILLTDGQTYGDETRCVELARRFQGMGVGITALGLGEEWNEDLLATMAAHGNSRSEYIAGAESIVDIFQEEMRLLQGIVARDMALSLQPATAVQFRKAFRVAPEVGPLPLGEAQGQERIVPLGEWMGTAPQVFLLELVVPPLSPGRHCLLHVGLTYSLPGDRGHRELRQEIDLPLARGKQERGQVPDKVRHALEKVMAYQMQELAWRDARQGNIEQATRRLEAAATRLVDLGEAQLAQIVEEEARRLERTGRTSSVGRKEIHYGTQRLGRHWTSRRRKD